MGTARLAADADEALALVMREPGVREAEVFVGHTETRLCRLSYTSHLPSNGVEEVKSSDAVGVGVRALFVEAGSVRIGTGSEPGPPRPPVVARALARARAAAVADPALVSLPRPGAAPPAAAPAAAEVDDGELIAAAWRIVQGAVRTFLGSPRLAEIAGDPRRLAALGLVVGGDVTVLRERAAVASCHLPAARRDDTTLVTAAVTALVEALDAKGSGWAAGTRLDAALEAAGVEAARQAIDGIGGERVPSGTYAVVLGPQAVADLLAFLVLPACTASAFRQSASPFLGRLGQPVAAPGLGVWDDGGQPARAGSRRLSCEGVAAGRTDLIRDGRLVGCLADWDESRRLLADPERARKLGGDDAAARAALEPRHGFRFAVGSGRRFDAPPRAAATAVVVDGPAPAPRAELLRRVGDGLYLGRFWYTYPVNGLAAGDFTCTVIGDSFLIRDGRLAAPLRPNVVRVHDNIRTVLRNVVGAGDERRPALVWAGDEVVYAPELAVSALRVEAIAGATEDPRP